MIFSNPFNFYGSWFLIQNKHSFLCLGLSTHWAPTEHPPHTFHLYICVVLPISISLNTEKLFLWLKTNPHQLRYPLKCLLLTKLLVYIYICNKQDRAFMCQDQENKFSSHLGRISNGRTISYWHLSWNITCRCY